MYKLTSQSIDKLFSCYISSFNLFSMGKCIFLSNIFLLPMFLEYMERDDTAESLVSKPRWMCPTLDSHMLPFGVPPKTSA